jgi:hypothetical protein
MVSQEVLSRISNRWQLQQAGFQPTRERYIPDYFSLDGTPGDYGDYLYRHPVTGQEVTLSVSREFGIFDVHNGNTLGKNRYS